MGIRRENNEKRLTTNLESQIILTNWFHLKVDVFRQIERRKDKELRLFFDFRVSMENYAVSCSWPQVKAGHVFQVLQQEVLAQDTWVDFFG